MPKAIKISVFDKLKERIFTRTTIQDFLSRVSSLKEDNIILDFDKIIFISRSCADEYIKFMQSTKKNIQVINQSPEVSMMIKIVERGLNSISFSRVEDSSECIMC